jgi:argininosuccinate synthase
VNKVVLAYSGGLDTSVAVAWLREQFGAEVVTLTVDLGGGSLRPGVEARAISAGASRAYVVDARERFVTDFVWPHLQANALYQGAYPLATALARPLIAQLLVEVAKREGADAVAHGCTGKGNDQVRFDVATHALDPGLEVVAPMRVGMGLTRDQEIDYAAERGIEIPITKASPYSIDVNLWGRSCETGVLEDPWVTPPPDAYDWTVPAAEAPATVDGERLPPVELVERIHSLGGAHGVGRIDHVEDRLVGIKSREIYETPAATILHAAHRALEGLALSRDTLRFDRLVADELARLIYDGLWFSALSRDLRAYVASSQRVVSGEVRVRLDHGSAVVVGRRSPLSLYDKSLATYDEGDAFDHASAVGFIEIFGLPLRVEAARHGAVGKHHGAAWTWTDPLLADLPTKVTDPEPAAV